MHISGKVVGGDGRGRTLGFPTANVDVADSAPTVLARGVWAGWARLPDGTCWMMVANIGVRPTFSGGRVSVEAHLLGFQGDLYGVEVSMDLVAKVRDERRFSSAMELAAQIHVDVERARVLLEDDRVTTSQRRWSSGDDRR